jgi:hypothetical protein
MQVKNLDMHVSTVKTPFPNFIPVDLRLQLPLGIPDYHRRSKIKPHPVRPVVYFGEEPHRMPVENPRPEYSGTSPAS